MQNTRLCDLYCLNASGSPPLAIRLIASLKSLARIRDFGPPELLITCSLPLLALTGCTSEAPEAGNASLRDVSIPPGFTFQTSNSVALEIAPDDAVFESTPDAPVEVRRPDGAVLYRGAVRKGTPLKVEVAVPTAVKSLELSVGRQRSTMPINAPAAGGED